jgi:Domain of unknown function (DUF5916)/Carbohydrate family 9 binding domain-like
LFTLIGGRLRGRFVRSVGVFILAAPLLFGQDGRRDGAGTHGSKNIRATAIEQPIQVDGSLDEPEWATAPVSLGFIQRDPQEGQPSSERTEFRILYTPTTLYVGIICYDDAASGILARERRRDNSFENDDIVSIMFDTFHDHRNSFLFRTNPLGTQYDAMVTDEGQTTNSNWDEKWDVAATINEAGWLAEFAIPFKTLRVQESDREQTWGMDVERVIRRKNELSYWNNYRRGFNLENASQAGHLTGLEGIQTGLKLRVKPYLLGGFSHTSERSQSALCHEKDESVSPIGSATCNDSDIGLEVIKYRLTPSLTLDLTANTDFAQTEVDDQQVNLDRYSLFFPEKREFFQEGAGVYEFGSFRGEGGVLINLFHSRQIGLSHGQPVPIAGGGRITGRLAGLTVGLLNVQTEPVHRLGVPASNYGVLRVKRDVLERSSIGGFFINREVGGGIDRASGEKDFNRVYGADANLVFFRYLNISGLVSKSEAPGGDGDNLSTSGGVTWQSDFVDAAVTWLTVDKNFRDDLGYVPRKNQRRFLPRLALQPRPKNSSLFRQLVFRYQGEYVNTQDNILETRINHFTFEMRFKSGAIGAVAPHTRFERLFVPFEIRPGIVIPPGGYSWFFNSVRYRSNPALRFSWSGMWQHHAGFFGGKLDSVNFSPSVRISNAFSVEVEYSLNHGRFEAGQYMDATGNFPDREGSFTDHVINSRVNYNFNNQWLTSTSIQYNNTDSFVGFNFRLNYIYRPGDDFFFIYNEGRRVDGPFDGQLDRTVQGKLTYSFDF